MTYWCFEKEKKIVLLIPNLKLIIHILMFVERIDNAINLPPIYVDN